MAEIDDSGASLPVEGEGGTKGEGEFAQTRVTDQGGIEAESSSEKVEILTGLSEGQQALFKTWSHKLNLNNPRSLKRLNNAYTLIRHRYSEEDSSNASGHSYPRLRMLLGLECINDLAQGERGEILAKLLSGRVEDIAREELKEIAGQIAQEERQLVYLQVKNFVLPAIDGQLGDKA